MRQEQLAPLKPYLAEAYEETYAGTADLYVYFVSQGLRLLQRGGRLSYIASNSWLRANYAGPLRNFLRTQATVEQLIDLGDNRVFADAPDVYPAILVARRDTPNGEHSAQVAVFSRGEGVKQFERQVAAKRAPVSIHDQADTGWQLANDAMRQLLTRMMSTKQRFGDAVKGRMYRGVTMGANDVFVVDTATRDRLISADANSAKIIKRLVQGEDLRPWYYEDEGRWLIFTRRGIKINDYPAVKEYLEAFQERLEPRPEQWSGDWIGRKPGSYQWFEIQDSVDYYQAFDQSTIQYMRPLPIPDAPAAERDAIGDLAMNITAEARARYELHRRSRRRILADLGMPESKLNQKLTTWWELDFPAFRSEIQKVFKRGIPLKDRDDWEEWLGARRAEHTARTEAIIRMETDLNARVYALFDLTPAEIKIIEESTKYKYGEV